MSLAAGRTERLNTERRKLKDIRTETMNVIAEN